MRMPRLVSAVAWLASALAAQSPLTTTFVNNNGGSVGGGVYFNLTINIPVTISALDCNLGSTVNTVGSVDLFTCPTTHVGNENTVGPWTLMASGPVTAAGPGQPSNVALASGVPLAPGTYGVCLRHNNVAAAYTNGTGANQIYSTAEMTLHAGSALNVAFGGGTPFSPRVWNGSIHYGNGSGTAAMVIRSGTGCFANAVSFYEQFTAAHGSFDLSNSSFLMIPVGTGYSVIQSASTVTAPVASGLGLTDDSLSPPLLMPFTLVFPGGATNTIQVCSNGFIYLNGTGTSASYSPTVTDFLNGGPRLFPFWNDHLPNAINDVHYDVDNVNNRVLITWNAVGEFGGGGVCTMQVILAASGIVEFVYGTVTHPSHVGTPMCGFSPGAANRDGGNLDLSVAMPFFTSADSGPLGQGSQRPVIGTSINLTVDNIPGGSLAGLELIGRNSGGIPLPGAPGCTLYVLPILATIAFSTAASTAAIPISIPNDPSLVGGNLPVQAIVVNLNLNALGLISSNLATLTFGNI